MKPNIYTQLLTKMDSNGFTEPYNVSEFMNRYFPRENPGSWSDEDVQNATRILKELKTRNYIDYQPDNIHKVIHKVFVNNPGEISTGQWFDNTDVKVWFTPEGMEFLHRWEQTKAVIDTNAATVDTYKIQRIALIVSISVSIITVLIAFMSYLDGRGINEKIESLRKEQSLLKEQLGHQ